MAVPCPECGRQYDITLFAFGRSIHCECGRSIKLELDVDQDPTSAEED